MLGRLPQISVKVKVRGVWAENEEGRKENKVISTTPTEGLVRDWVPVHAEQEYVILIEITKEFCGFKVRKVNIILDFYISLGYAILGVCRDMSLISCTSN